MSMSHQSWCASPAIREIVATFACFLICFAFLTPLAAQEEEPDDEGAIVETPGAAVPVQLPPGAAGKPGAGAPGQPPAAPPPALPFAVTNIEDKQFQAKEMEFKEGKLTVKSDPPQTVALDELQKAVFTHETKLAVEWLGQENRDLVQVGSAEGGNGIRDIRFRATGLAAKGLKQVAVVCRAQFRAWRLDVKQSPHWKIAVERIGQASVADFYFEPPAKDLFEKDLEITLTFDDNSTAKATLKAAGHTSDQTPIEGPADGPAANPNRLATFQLDAGDSIKGRILRGNGEQVTIETAWQHPRFRRCRL